MNAFRRFTALAISVSLILAQGQEVFAQMKAVIPVQTGGVALPAVVPAAAMGGLVGPRSVGIGGSLAGLSVPLTGVLPSVVLPQGPRTGAAAAAPRTNTFAAGLPAVSASVPSAAARRSAAEPLIPAQRGQDEGGRPRASIAVLEDLAVPERSAPSASDSAGAERSGRFSAAFDGSMQKPGRAAADVAPVVADAQEASPLARLSVPVLPGGGAAAPRVAGKASSQREKAASRWQLVKENRFLIAAVAGAAVGLAGVNLGALPLLSMTPGLFFGALPWLAAPFIGLNVYKSFAHYSVIKESRTLLGFLVITVAGLAISAGVTMGMTALLPVVDPASIAAAAIPGLGGGSFSPMQFMLPIIGTFTWAALVYKRARGVNDGSAQREYGSGWKGTLLRLYDRAVGLFINARTAPFLEKAGRLGEKGTELINKLFPRFIDVVGIPAVAVLLSMTMATGGLGLLNAFSGYYLTAFAGMAVGFAALLAAYFAFGARAKDFKEILKAALVGFSISSSSASMPTERETLKAMGVSRRTRDTVVPLGGVFNMFGTALYMGLTAFYALSMFGAAPTLVQYFNTALAVLIIAMGAPGIPASNITLLDPVLRQTGLQAAQIDKVYTMILPADRILDMVQTALNVMGDMLPAVEQDRKRLRYVRAKHIRELREKREAEERAKGKTPPAP